MPRTIAILLFALTITGHASAADSIVTIAGGGPTFSECPALQARLNIPQSLVLDAAGNIYIADTNNQRVCKVDANGNLTTIAGNGIAGYSGDGGPAKDSMISSPAGIVVDSSGNIYFAEQYNQIIRKIDAAGNISTIAGGGSAAATGSGESPTSVFLQRPFDIALGPAGEIVFVDTDAGRIFSINNVGLLFLVAGNGTVGFSGDGGPAKDAAFNSISSIAIDAQGNLFIADSGNNRVRRVDAATGTISTYAGSGVEEFSGDGGPATSAGISLPLAITLDAAGNLYISDGNHQRIRKVDAATKTISTVVGSGVEGFYGDGGPALNASLLFPTSLRLDSAGNLLFTDACSNRVRKVGPSVAAGNSYDSDGDGFSDHIEAAALTNPSDAGSTPFSGQPANNFIGMILSKCAVKMNFPQAAKDSIQISGTVYVPDTFSVSGQPVLLDVGGRAFAFSLDAKGKSTPKGDNSFSAGPKVKDSAMKFTAKLTKGDFAAALADENLINTDTTGTFVVIPVTIYLNQTVYTEASFTQYKAKLNKSGAVSKSGGVGFSAAGGLGISRKSAK